MSKKCFIRIIAGILLGVLFMALIPDKPSKKTTTDEMVAMAMKDCQKITASELEKLMQGEEVYTLIDVRQELEHYYGYIPGSVILPRGSLEFNIGDENFWETQGIYMPMKDETIVVYCKKGSRGALAALTLKSMGYKKIFYLEDGFKKWELTYPDQVEKNLEALGGGNHEEKSGGC